MNLRLLLIELQAPSMLGTLVGKAESAPVYVIRTFMISGVFSIQVYPKRKQKKNQISVHFRARNIFKYFDLDRLCADIAGRKASSILSFIYFIHENLRLRTWPQCVLGNSLLPIHSVTYTYPQMNN